MRREAAMLLNLTIVLTAIGLLLVYSSSPVIAVKQWNLSPLHFFYRQAAFAVVGCAVMALAMRFDYHALSRPWMLLLVVTGTLGCLIAVLIPGIGVEVGGAQRWLAIGGFRFQPSEIAKVAVIVITAAILLHRREHIGKFFGGYMPPLAAAAILAGLVYFQNDLGTPFIMMAIALFMLLAGGARIWHLGLCGALGVAAVTLMILHKPHRIERVKTFLDPWADPSNTGLQLVQSMTAFARGGLFGQGPGAGEQKLLHLPSAHTDFIFAVWAEEMGLAGSALLVLIFAAFTILAFRVAMNARDYFGACLASGIAALIALQASLNMAVTMGLLPTKGLSLPFISAGGSGLIVHLALVGVLLNIALQSEVPAPARTAAPVAR